MFEVMFALIFLVWLGLFVCIAARNVRQWHRNNNSPRLTVEAVVSSKRHHVSHHFDANTHTNHMSTSYYVTFQVASGDRMELHVSGREYGMLAEGDLGDLSFQGTRYLGFVRRIPFE